MIEKDELTSTFTAHDRHGREYVIYVFTKVFETQSDKGTSRDEGVKFLRLHDGTSVRRLGKGRYEIVGPPSGNAVVTSDDANAP
ncbi:MAG: hypothetical protein ACLQLG_19370 [Thermoguttaceae bacterium]